MGSSSAADEKYHTGTAEEAVVGVEVVNSTRGGLEVSTKRGLGFVIRCDGFVLVPTSLFAHPPGPETEQAVTVILNPGKPAERRIPALRPRWLYDDVGFAALKLSGVHLPALRTRLPAPGEKPRPGVPVGSPVLGEDGLAVGMVTGTDGAWEDFGKLGRVTNCVTPVPMTEAEFEARQKADADAGRRDAMVSVPGGKVRLPATVLAEQRDMEREPEACVAPFKIDKYAVTNADYLRYWESLPEADRKSAKFRATHYPAGWADTAAPFPGGQEYYPVVGVTPQAAADYARSRGKRLPTPYEWCLAAFGPKGESEPPEWVARYIEARRAAWEQLGKEHRNYAAAHADLFDPDPFARPQSPSARDSAGSLLPWIVARGGEAVDISRFSEQTLTEAAAELSSDWRLVMLVSEVMMKDFDRGPFGSVGMTMNVPELFAAAPPARRSPRYVQIVWLPAPPPGGFAPIESCGLSRDSLDADGSLRRRFLLRLGSVIGCSFDARTPAGRVLAAVLSTVSRMALIVDTVRPLAGWRVYVGSETALTAQVDPAIVASIAAAVEAGAGVPQFSLPGYNVWLTRSFDAGRSIGRLSPLTHPELAMPRPGPPELFYLVPIGFRCAR